VPVTGAEGCGSTFATGPDPAGAAEAAGPAAAAGEDASPLARALVSLGCDEGLGRGVAFSAGAGLEARTGAGFGTGGGASDFCSRGFSSGAGADASVGRGVTIRAMSGPGTTLGRERDSRNPGHSRRSAA
jgi:hypothetical protein